ncbi:MAG: bifunctional phosphoribosyl-AMP cyclohydrolase/phosphoribosyl-ATP diphosphatase HisIE [Gemmatimonadetes bacterium]|nr:bifunctional phosphoribosyl-AMP cyclohydrolase/phosphoribosyl-ATP diphosphatase HisIE [Gemmatimonadota bacterium]
MRLRTAADLDRVDFTRTGGLVPVVAQDVHTGAVLMLAWANREALERALETGEAWYFSRSRNTLWHKGATSGNVQRLVELHLDCDADAVLALVEPAGPACHTGARTCFDGAPTLAALDRVLEARAAADAPPGSHTARLLGDRNLRLKKLGEEATELAVACADEDRERAAEEAADLVYHALVACRALGIPADAVLARLEGRLKR